MSQGHPVRRLGDLLVAEGYLTGDQLGEALGVQRSTGESLESIVVRLQLVREDQLISLLSRQYGIPAIELADVQIDPDLLELVPHSVAKKYELLPIKRSGKKLTLAMADPTNVFAVDTIAFMTDLQVARLVAAPADIRAAIARAYPTKSDVAADAPAAADPAQDDPTPAEITAAAVPAIDEAPPAPPVEDSVPANIDLPRGAELSRKTTLSESPRDTAPATTQIKATPPGPTQIKSPSPAPEQTRSAAPLIQSHRGKAVVTEAQAPAESSAPAMPVMEPPPDVSPIGGSLTGAAVLEHAAIVTVVEPSPSTPVRRPQPGSRRIGDLLVADGLINAEQLARALAAQKGTSEKLGSILLKLDFVQEDQLIGFLSRQYGVPAMTLSQLDIDPEVLRLVPAAIAKKYEVLPVQRQGSQLTLAMADPSNLAALDDLAFMTNLQVMPVVASQAAIRQAIERNYEAQAGAISDVLTALANDVSNIEVVEDDGQNKVDVFELKESADEAPVVKLVNMVLVDAIMKGASDIHWEPYEKVFRIRLRIDGVLHEMLAPPKRLEAAIISRLKIMSNLDIAERRLPQDGRIKLRYNTREIDFRVSILPTIFGEKAVLRILDKNALKLDLTALGFDPWSLEKFGAAIHQPYGMVLITGPTGSGKTTTLYSAIHTINKPEHNIMTAEDPVEYNLKGVNQVQVDEGVGRTFAAALRSFLRQDPDVILVGETRDLETAQISIRAALTGHLVFSTLHTNDCPSTIARLVDMGIPPFLISSALVLILAQRLGRKICGECKEPYEADEDSLVPYGHVPTGIGKTQFYKGKGCQRCSFTGMKGRVAIYEVMPISEELRDAILKNAPTAELREVAQAQGMKTLRQSGLQKVLEGTTTVEEVLRVTMS